MPSNITNCEKCKKKRDMTDRYLPRPSIERLRKCDAMRVMWRVWFALQLPPAAAVQTQHATFAGLSELS